MLDCKMTNNRRGEEWYVCNRCGFQYPRSSMMNQNGLNLCFGLNTVNCRDKPSQTAALQNLDIPYEDVPQPLPDSTEDL